MKFAALLLGMGIALTVIGFMLIGLIGGGIGIAVAVIGAIGLALMRKSR